MRSIQRLTGTVILVALSAVAGVFCAACPKSGLPPEPPYVELEAQAPFDGGAGACPEVCLRARYLGCSDGEDPRCIAGCQRRAARVTMPTGELLDAADLDAFTHVGVFRCLR